MNSFSQRLTRLRIPVAAFLLGVLLWPLASIAEDDLEYVDIDTLLKDDGSDKEPAPVKPKTPADSLQEFVNIDEILYDEATVKRQRAAETSASGNPSRQAVESELQSLRKKVIDVNKDLSSMERFMLYPVSSQLNVFVSVEDGSSFSLDSVALKVNDRLVASHLYTDRELGAMQRGGIQRLFTGNVKKGDHELVAMLVGKQGNGKDYKRAVSVVFGKDAGAKNIELKIQGNGNGREPVVQFKEWE